MAERFARLAKGGLSHGFNHMKKFSASTSVTHPNFLCEKRKTAQKI